MQAPTAMATPVPAFAPGLKSENVDSIVECWMLGKIDVGMLGAVVDTFIDGDVMVKAGPSEKMGHLS